MAEAQEQGDTRRNISSEENAEGPKNYGDTWRRLSRPNEHFMPMNEEERQTRSMSVKMGATRAGAPAKRQSKVLAGGARLATDTNETMGWPSMYTEDEWYAVLYERYVRHVPRTDDPQTAALRLYNAGARLHNAARFIRPPKNVYYGPVKLRGCAVGLSCPHWSRCDWCNCALWPCMCGTGSIEKRITAAQPIPQGPTRWESRGGSTFLQRLLKAAAEGCRCPLRPTGHVFCAADRLDFMCDRGRNFNFGSRRRLRILADVRLREFGTFKEEYDEEYFTRNGKNYRSIATQTYMELDDKTVYVGPGLRLYARGALRRMRNWKDLEKGPTNFPYHYEEHDAPIFPKNKFGEVTVPFINGKPVFPKGLLGDPIFPLNANGHPTVPFDDNGNPIFPLDANNNPILPKDGYGNMIYPRDTNNYPIFPRGPDGSPIVPFDMHSNPIFPRAKDGTPIWPRDKKGNIIAPIDSDGMPMFPRDEAIRPIFPKNKEGKVIFPKGPTGAPIVPIDAEGQPVFPVDIYGKPVYPVNEDGEPLAPLDPNGMPLFAKDLDGNPIFPKDAKDNIAFPKGPEGNPEVPLRKDGTPIYPKDQNGTLIFPKDKENNPVIPVDLDGLPLFPVDSNRVPIYPKNEEGVITFPKGPRGEFEIPTGPDGHPYFPRDASGAPIFPTEPDGSSKIPFDLGGRPILPLNPVGKPIFPKDKEGKPILPKDASGKIVLPIGPDGEEVVPSDEEGEPISLEGQPVARKSDIMKKLRRSSSVFRPGIKRKKIIEKLRPPPPPKDQIRTAREPPDFNLVPFPTEVTQPPLPGEKEPGLAVVDLRGVQLAIHTMEAPPPQKHWLSRMINFFKWDTIVNTKNLRRCRP